VWFDSDVLRLNYDGRGTFIGEFLGEDKILVVLKNGDFYVSNFDLTNHFDPNILRIEKYDEHKIWTAALFDADQGYTYLKRFTFDATEKVQNFLGDNPASALYLLTDTVYPRIKASFGGHDDFREPIEVEAEEFIAVKSFKAKGKRIANYEIKKVEELEPTRFPEPDPEPESSMKVEIEDDDETPKSESDIIDEITGQMKLFDE